MTSSALSFTKRAWVVTFYAFKGGTGRTLALSNVARLLAENRGYRVGVVDLDLDSPGLPHQALCPILAQSGDHKKRAALLDCIDESRGFVDLVNDLYRDSRVHTVRSPADISLSFDKLARSVIPLPSESHNGSVLLMPAARGSVSRSDEFLGELYRFTNNISSPPDSKSGLSAEQQNGTQTPEQEDVSTEGDESIGREDLPPYFTSVILERFVEEYSLDYVFIDGRTGVGAFFPVYALAIPHALVLFMGLNEQNIKGSLEILERTSLDSESRAPVFLVASPVPTADVHYVESRVDELERRLQEIRMRQKDTPGYIYHCPSQVDFHLPYVTLATCQETYFPHDFPRSPLSAEYLRLADQIEQLKAAPPSQLTPVADTDPESVVRDSLCRAATAQPLRLAVEDVHRQAMQQFLRKVGLSLADSPESLSRVPVDEFSYEGTEVVEVGYWSATDSDSPWEQLADDPQSFPSREFMPDILTTPQHLLPDILACPWPAEQSWLDIGREYKDHRRRSRDVERMPYVIDFSFLDTNYPGWRRWCIPDATQYAIPFSANATLLCANQQDLTDLCNSYWAHRPSCAGSAGPFIPSSWHLLRSLLKTTTRRNKTAFAFASEGRGLYYEWLNVVLSFGCADIEFDDGDNPIVTRIRDCALPTKVFLDLFTSATDAAQPRSMSNLISAFGKSELSIYVAWTDSFRFHWDDHLPSDICAVTIPRTGRTRTDDVPIRLGLIPREVSYPRRPLLANWVATFRSDQRYPDRKDAAVRLMDYFLGLGVQADLLKCGFPSASRTAIAAEIRSEALRERTQSESQPLVLSSYGVFLRSLKGALDHGHRVRAMPHARKIINMICSTLRSLTETWHDNGRVETALNELHKRVDLLL